MSTRLPKTIKVGSFELRRAENEDGCAVWKCEDGFNEMRRCSRTKLWNFDGSPLGVSYSSSGWFGTPEAAFRGHMLLQLSMLRKNYNSEARRIRAEIAKTDK